MKRFTAFIFAILVFVFNLTAFASGVDDLLEGKQELVVLGSVKDITSDKTTITVDHVLSRNGSDLVGTDIKVKKFSYTYCEEHSTSDFRNPIISDNIVISLNAEDEDYSIANCAYKVDSNEYAGCKIIVLDSLGDEECIQQMQKVTCYIRANGMVTDFEFDSEGRIYAVYPQAPEQCFKLVDEDGTTINNEEAPEPIPVVNAKAESKDKEKALGNRSVYALAIVGGGAVLGLIAGLIIRVKKAGK